MKKDRFLLAILAAIGVLIAVALALFFLRRDSQDYVDANDPSSVVRNYVLAMQKGDFERAYALLAETDRLPDLLSFEVDTLTRKREIDRLTVLLGNTQQSERKAVVTVTVVYPSDSPFSSSWRDVSSALVVQDEQGNWKIVQMPYPFWQANWYLEKASP